jgi:hypothetical protein
VGTLVAVETLTVPVVVSRHCSVKMSPPLKESEDVWFPSCLPLWLSEERRKTTSEKQRSARSLSTQDERGIYST